MLELPHAGPVPEIYPDVVLVSIPDGYTPGPWEATEDEDCWRLLGRNGVPQILKAPKRGTPYAEYWPDPKDAVLILMAPDLALALKKVIAERDELRTRNRGLSAMVLKLMEQKAMLEVDRDKLTEERDSAQSANDELESEVRNAGGRD